MKALKLTKAELMMASCRERERERELREKKKRNNECSMYFQNLNISIHFWSFMAIFNTLYLAKVMTDINLESKHH